MWKCSSPLGRERASGAVKALTTVRLTWVRAVFNNA